MPKEKKKYWNPQKVFTALESVQIMRKKYLSEEMPTIEKRILLKESQRLLDQVKKEYDKPIAPLGSYPFDESKLLGKHYRTYIDELEWDTKYNQKPIRDPLIKLVKRGMYGTSKEKFDDIFRMIRIHTKKLQMIKKLNRLRFTTEQEVDELAMVKLYQIIDSYLISKYTSQMIKNFEVTIKRGKAIVKRPNLNELEAQMDNCTIMKDFLEDAILMSAILQDESLSKVKRDECVKEREKFRENFKSVRTYEFRRMSQNGESFESFMDEVHGANKNMMKVVDLYIEAGKPYQLDIPKTKKETYMKEIYELREILKKDDLTSEERKYFLERESVLEKEIDLEGGLKDILADFPYDDDLNEVRKRRYGI